AACWTPLGGVGTSVLPRQGLGPVRRTLSTGLGLDDVHRLVLARGEVLAGELEVLRARVDDDATGDSLRRVPRDTITLGQCHRSSDRSGAPRWHTRKPAARPRRRTERSRGTVTSHRPGRETMSEERRRELGETDFPVEQHLQEAFDRTMEEGAERLHRTVRSVVITGLFGGMEVGLGVMAFLAVLHETDSHLLAGLAFGAGFIAVLLAHSELFTEDFLVPVMGLVTRQASFWQLVKLWVGTLLANLVGGWAFMWIVVQAFPQWWDTLEESARHFVDAPFTLQT